MYKENGLNYIETQAEEDFLNEFVYRSSPLIQDLNNPDYEGDYPYTVANKMEVGAKVYTIHEGVSRGGHFVVPGVIEEIVAVTPADGPHDTQLRSKHSWNDSFLSGNTRYHVGIKKI